ncbi:unnamed protein product [Parajaminaea phylloscopi]
MAAKRKSPKAGPSRALAPQAGKKPRMQDENSDDFDDGQDLLATALAAGSEADSMESLSEGASDGFEPPSEGYEDEGDENDFELLDSGEEEASDAGAATTVRDSSTRNKAALYALPTNEEMQGLRETGELFKTNILKLQIEEMLASVRPKYHKSEPLELVLRRLQSVVQSIDDVEPTPVSGAGQAIQTLFPAAKVSIPYCEPVPSGTANYKLAFQKPSNIQMIGSWALKAAAERPGGLDVDIALMMPSALFQEKDHLNFRYFHKRAFYLAVLAAAIGQSSKQLGVTASYGLENGDTKRPILVLRPIPDKSETDFSKIKASIKIYLACQGDIFPLNRLAPSRNNIRVAEADKLPKATAAHPATPHYNNAILADSLRSAHLVYLHATMKQCPAFADAAILLRIWAYQRGFGSGHEDGGKLRSRSSRRMALGSDSARFVLSMILAHLLHGEEKLHSKTAHRAKLSNGFSSYQLFRGVIDWLATHDFSTSPVFMKSSPAHGLASRSDKVQRTDFAEHYARALVDPSGTVNLLAQWLPGSVDALRHEAKTTFALLDDAETDHFNALFLEPRDNPAFRFDEICRLRLKLASEKSSAYAEVGNRLLSRCLDLQRTFTSALRSRCHSATFFVPANNSDGLAGPAADTVEVGLLYDGAQAFKIVEHGPSPDDKAAAEAFQTFWGEVAELRRFKDGRILHSIVWEIQKQSERWSIPHRIVRHALSRHHSMQASKVEFCGDTLGGLLVVPESVASDSFLASPEEKGFQLVQSAYDTLAKQLRALEDLPLALIDVTPSNPGLRSMSTFIPAPLDLGTLGSPATPDCASFLPAQDIILTFESSGKWPDELKAIQAMKLAFCQRLASILPKQIDGIQVRVALDADAASSAMQDQASLELVLSSGLAFRARIYHERERVLLQRIIADKRGEPPARRDEAARALDRFQGRFVRGPRHHAAMATLSHRYAALSDTCRLLKRWVRAHMLDGDGHVPEEALELLALTAFVCPGSSVPSTGHAGFLQILKRLSTWKWREEPMLIPVHSAISVSEQLQRSDETEGGVASTRSLVRFPTERRVQAVEAFKLARAQDPSLSRRAWFFATEDDTSSESFTTRGPSGATAHALQGLAVGAVKLLETFASESRQDTGATMRSLFTPGMSAFDFVIHLRPQVLPRYAPHFLGADSSVWLGSANDTKKGFRNARPALGSSSSFKSAFGPTPRPDFDPAAALVRLLRELYSDSLRLYHDPHGSPFIGGIFNPLLAQEKRRFKVAAGFNSAPVAAEKGEDSQDKASQDQVRLNSRAILAEIERLGEGLVDHLEVRRS